MYGSINKNMILHAAVMDYIIQLWLFSTDITPHLSPSTHAVA